MNRIVAWFATNHVAANLLMGFAILAGLASLTQIPVKLYPDVEVPIITVTVEYLGAAPEEVESGVCTRIEEHVEGLAGMKELRATAPRASAQWRWNCSSMRIGSGRLARSRTGSTVGMLAPDDWHEQLLQRLLVLIGNVSPEGILYDGVRPYAFHGVDGVRHAMSLDGFAEHFNAASPRDRNSAR